MFTQIQIRNFLEIALNKAEEALKLNNYPIGCVVVDSEGNIVAETMNECTTSQDISAHAEIVALRKIGNSINKYSNGDHYLFTSLEPCFGCSFFIARSNIREIYSALKDPHKGGTSDLRSQEQFSDFFQKIHLFNEPFDDLAIKSRKLMRKYFLNIGNNDAAEFYK
jgi:tRNA(adenine34) deaminase